MKNRITLTLCLFVGTCLAQPSVNIVPFALGFNNGISDIVHAGDSRLFIVEQLGYISIVDSAGNVSPNYFLNIHNKVTPTTFTPGNEQGLLGLAFSPDYPTDGYFYVNYTNKTGVGNTVISRFQVSANPDSADPFSETVLLNIYQPYPNHNGGALKFGSDGYLYVALGDGGLAGDPGNRAQNTDSLLGKILRINVTGIGAGGYTIPPTNPFASGGGAPEVWAYGLRNPWKITFDRSTNNLWISDVGQNIWEEINFQPSSSTGGENYGWRCYEGTHVYNTTGCGPLSSYDSPVYEYSHNATGGCAITGGYVYRGVDFPDLTGYYFFSDYCNGQIYALSPNYTQSIAGTFAGNLFTTFGENASGELFIASQNNGTVYRVISIATAVEDYSADVNSISVYPNPNRGFFTCEVDASNKVNADIEITDISGRICYKNTQWLNLGHNNVSVDMTGTASGSYLMKITTENGTVFKKFEIFQ